MADGRIEIDTAINTDGAEKGVKTLSGKLKNLGGGSIIKGLGNVGMAFGGITVAVQVATKAMKAAAAVVKDLTETYKVQAKAETQLQAAAKNNPYLTGESVTALKNFASELQGVTTYGDEQLLPLMATLASSGRTQAEIMDVMNAAIDVSASGIMSLESAVKYLNSSYGGLAGELGERIPQVKALTAEEMKQGKAVELVAKQYKGISAEVTKATGTSEQLKNALGDLKEEMGAPFEKALAPVRKFFTEIISGWASAKKAKREYEEGLEEAAAGGTSNKAESAAVKAFETEIEKANDRISALQKSYDNALAKQEKAYAEVTQNGKKSLKDLSDLDKEYYQQFVDATNDVRAQIEKQRDLIDGYKDSIAQAQNQIAKNNADEEAENEKQRIDAEIAARDALRNEYDATIAAKKEEIENRRRAGEEITKEAEALELYNTAFEAYKKMISDPAFKGNSLNYEHEVNARAEIQGYAQSAFGADALKDAEELRAKFKEIYEQTTDDAAAAVREQYTAMLGALDAEYNAVIASKYLEAEKKKEIDAEYKDARIELEKQMNEAIKKAEEDALKEQRQMQLDSIADMAATVNSFTSQFADIFNQVTGLMRQNMEAETTAETAAISEQYTDGLISYEEYCEKKKQIDKKAAQEEYKIKMIEWTMQLAQATANVAAGVSKSIADYGYPVGIAMGALAAVAGALQIATIVANKPRQPAFATGGIVGGNSYTGDNVPIRVNSGERILTKAQSDALENSIASLGNGGASVNLSVKVINNAANDVSAKTQMTEQGLRVIIDKMVNTSMQQGNYTDSMNIANSRQNGATYL